MHVIKAMVLLLFQPDSSFGGQVNQVTFHNALHKIVSANPKHQLLSRDHPSVERTVYCDTGGKGIGHINLHDKQGERTRMVIVNDVNVLNGCPNAILMDDGEGHGVEEANRITAVNIAFIAASSRHDNLVYGIGILEVRGLQLLAFDGGNEYQIKEITVKNKSARRRARDTFEGMSTGLCLQDKSKYCIHMVKKDEIKGNKMVWFEEPSREDENVDVLYSEAMFTGRTRRASFASLAVNKAGNFYVMRQGSPKIEVIEYRNKEIEGTGKFILPRSMSYMGMLRKETERNVLLAEDTQLFLLSSSLLVEGKASIDESDLRLKLPAKKNYIFVMQGNGLIMFVSKKYPFKVGIMNV